MPGQIKSPYQLKFRGEEDQLEGALTLVMWENLTDPILTGREVVSGRYPTAASQDFTSIIDDKAFARLNTALQDAIDKGAEPVNLLGEDEPSADTRKMPPYLLLNPSDEMLVMKEEIFGPILPVKTYEDLGEVIDYINSNERPLALYLYPALAPPYGDAFEKMARLMMRWKLY